MVRVCKPSCLQWKALALAAVCLWLSVVPTSAQLFDLRNDNQKKAIIFIHGIVGSAKDNGKILSTFTNEQHKAYWPDLMKDDEFFNGIDLFTYQYELGQDIQSLADQIVSNVFNSDQLKSKDELFVVAHSMGGLVVRRAIVATNLDPKRIKALYLFGVPMDGSAWANLVSMFADDTGLRQLRFPSRSDNDRDEFLHALRVDWINKAISIPTYCAYETKGYKGTKLIVPLSSVEPLCNSALFPIQADHLGMVKPSSRKDDDIGGESYRVLRDWFRRTVPEWKPTNKTLEQTAEALVANCTAGRQYTATIHNDLAQLMRSEGGLKTRVSQPLPPDWGSSDRPLLWRYAAPRILIVHFSCFHQGDRSDAAYRERTNDFLALLESLENTTVKILVYSSAFKNKSFARSFVKPSQLAKAYKDRLALFTVDGAEADIAKSAEFAKCAEEFGKGTPGICPTLGAIQSNSVSQ